MKTRQGQIVWEHIEGQYEAYCKELDVGYFILDNEYKRTCLIINGGISIHCEDVKEAIYCAELDYKERLRIVNELS